MKSTFKIVAGLLIALVVVGAITILAVKYFDVLVRGYETLRDTVRRKKSRFFGGDCYDFEDEDDFEELAEEV